MLKTIPSHKADGASERAWAWISREQACRPKTAAVVRRGNRRSAPTCHAQQNQDTQACKQRLNSLAQGTNSQFTCSQGPTAVSAAGGSFNSALRNTLPDPLLFSNIKSCNNWVDCQRLLVANAEQLDAMLLSTLVTQTVYVSQGPAQQRQATAAHSQQQHSHTSNVSDNTNRHNQEHRDSLQPTTSPESEIQSKSTRSSRPSNSKAAYNRYLQQLADESLLLIGGFRAQQFSNVLWGLAKCGYKVSPVFIDKYLAQAELQLHHFPPRNLAQLIWALAALQARPCRSFLCSFLAESNDKITQFKPIDIANTLWGLATLGVKPPLDWLQHALDVAQPQWFRFKPQELSIAIWGLAKLGLGFRGQSPSPGFSHAGGGLSSEGLNGLLAAVGFKLPSMSPQEVSNLLWGLAAGRADLGPQQVQFLAEGALRVLHKYQLTSSSSSSSSSGASSNATGRDLCSCKWALTRLNWTPSIQQARCLLFLLQQYLSTQQQQQQWAYSSSSSSSRHTSSDSRLAATFLLCLSKLRIRPPEDVITQLLLLLQKGLAHPAATAADLVQGLAGCQGLGWRPSRSWWRGFYNESVGVLQDEASVVELSRVLGYMAGLRALKPTSGWWMAFWQQVAVYTDATFAEYGLKQRDGLAVVPGRTVSSSSSSSSLLAAAAEDDDDDVADHLAAAGRRRRQTSTTSRLASATAAVAVGDDDQEEQQQQGDEQGDLRALLADMQQPWSEIQQNMQQLTQLRTAVQEHRSLAYAASGSQRNSQSNSLTDDHQLVNPQSTLLLLWACVKLKKLPVKKVLWQLLVLVLVDLHSYTPQQLTVIMWSVAMLITRHGANRVQCHRVLKLLVVGAQWRLHTGLAGEGNVEKRFAGVLRFLAVRVGVQRLLMLKYRSGYRVG